MEPCKKKQPCYCVRTGMVPPQANESPTTTDRQCLGYEQGCGCDKCLSTDKMYQDQLERARARRLQAWLTDFPGR